jgi:5-formyltetrahydrofolate cyclo-ligase
VAGRFPDEMSPDELFMYRSAAKEALRKRLSALRRTLDQAARTERAREACARLVREPEFERAQVLLSYAPLRFELDPDDAVQRALALGKQVLLPRVIPDSHELALHVYMPGDELEESGMGVREPLPTSPRMAPERVDLVLVPGLAFDARGFRLGFGKGYYDRLLPTLPRAARFGLAFELSLLPEVPCEEHDAPMDVLITEKRLLRMERPGLTP